MPRWLERLQPGALLLTAFLYSAGYGTIGMVLLLLTVALEAGVTRHIPWERSPLDVSVVIFLGVFMLSGYLSAYKPTAVASTGLAALTIYLALGVAARVLERHRDLLTRLLWVWLAGAALAAGWAIALHLRTGLPAFTPALGQNAVGTTMLIAAFLGLGLCLCVSTRWRYVAAAMSAAALGALALSYTRGAWLGTAIGVAVVLGLGGRHTAKRVVVIGSATIVALAFVAGADRTALVQRALTIPNPSANADRLFLFRAAGAIILDHPVLGTGMNTFSLTYPRYRLPGDPNPLAQPYAHNIFLNIAAEGGLLALAAFIVIVVQTVRFGWRWRAAARTEAERALRTALLAAFAGMMVHQLVDGTLLSVHLGAGMWIIIAILTSSPPRHA